ncbi:hypothetical protein DOTSEDRAFT_70624 [Lecanosticta acicola]|uniref:Calcofluor white hypersensitive protein n=1 Tax=Lecanosticta acicola TaxID=111012 RepID=A0AAI8W0G1_9PEZI|nr:hypothetical protein DOTSEDRAFT_70624 [Lecanosticta acicola]
MSNRAVTFGGAAVLAGVGYYFYQAGGDPKVAQKKAEADAAKASSEIKSHLPGQAKEVKKDAEAGISEAGAKVNQYIRDAKSEASKVDEKLEQYRKDAANQLDKTSQDARKNANAAIDSFDKNVTEGAAKAKSGISSWFGGSNEKK